MTKIHYTSYSDNPFILSITYSNDRNELKQLTINDENIHHYLEINKLTIETLKQQLQDNEDLYNDLIMLFAPLDFQKIKEEAYKIDKELDLTKIDQELFNALKNMTEQNKSKNEIVAWVKFAKKTTMNLDPIIRQQLYGWISYLIQEQSFSLTEDGDILGYKGVSFDNYSKKSGTAYVDGKKVSGKIPNNINSVITMDRNKVEANQLVTCSYGLHVGSFNYANEWGDKVILVSFSPEDVVSIPIDHNNQKLRCCKYKVLKEVTEPLKERLLNVQKLLTD